ncbi:hypothetical protein I547_7740 [Mycobacterium kansasii 824]|nr:hypothetical protein I547_7740 [Mycobacterium kansasii 824]
MELACAFTLHTYVCNVDRWYEPNSPRHEVAYRLAHPNQDTVM